MDDEPLTMSHAPHADVAAAIVAARSRLIASALYLQCGHALEPCIFVWCMSQKVALWSLRPAALERYVDIADRTKGRP
jgi:hypothetical protein